VRRPPHLSLPLQLTGPGRVLKTATGGLGVSFSLDGSLGLVTHQLFQHAAHRR
jgi:hypothetical protein